MDDTAHKCFLSALFVGGYEDQRSLVREVFRKCGWRLFEVPDRPQATQCLRQHPVQVVIAKSDMPDGGWQELLGHLRCLVRPPAADRHLPHRRRTSVGRSPESRRLRCSRGAFRTRRNGTRRRFRPPPLRLPARASPRPGGRSGQQRGVMERTDLKALGIYPLDSGSVRFSTLAP
jgi:hypothetical protein